VQVFKPFVAVAGALVSKLVEDASKLQAEFKDTVM